MKGNPPLPFDSRPIVLLFANPSGLSVSLIESLLSNFCRVQIISQDSISWRTATEHLSGNRAVEIFEMTKSLTFESFDYVLVVDRGFHGGADLSATLAFVDNLLETNPVNTLFVASYLQYAKFQKSVSSKLRDIYKRKKETSGVVYVGQTLGPRIHLNDYDLLSKIVKETVIEGEVEVPTGDTALYPVHVAGAAKEIVRLLFSFGGVGQESLVVGHKSDVGEVVKATKKQVPSLLVKYTNEDWEVELPSVSEKRKLSINLQDSLKETFEWYISHPPTTGKKKKKEMVPKKKEKKVELSRIELPQLSPLSESPPSSASFFNKTTGMTIGLIIAILLLPFLLLGIGGGSLVLAKRSMLNGRMNQAKVLKSIAAVSTKTSSTELSLLSSLPFVGGAFEGAQKTSVLIEDSSRLVGRLIKIGELGKELFANVLGDSEYDVASYSEPMALEMDTLYSELSFLESEYSEGTGLSAWVFDKATKGSSLEELRIKILPAQRIIKESPVLLGSLEKKTYLVLFQNNMELRPTGGFIGSFALVTFENGRLVDISVQDVYSADGQLKGYVEPPEPIENYLGEANWYLRDSNWDPDFQISAQRAEWFLDKELNLAVDGVVGIDLELAKSLVGVSGPIYLDDFGKEITADNLYEATQYEVEDDFFPGSRKKANFLTSLTRELLNQLLNVKQDKLLDTGLVLTDSLEKKHIQIFLHNNAAQRAVADLGWSGAVYQPTCPGNCFAEYLGIVEANLGVNKANYFISRSADLDIRMGEGSILHTLRINIKNTASAALGDKGRYENYMRLLAPQNSTFEQVMVEGPNSEDVLDPDIREIRGRKEAGVFVEIAPGQERTIVYTWETPTDLTFEESGQYRFVWRKQAGTVSDPIEVTIAVPFPQNTVALPDTSLTEAGTYRYNTELAEDFAPRIFW